MIDSAEAGGGRIDPEGHRGVGQRRERGIGEIDIVPSAALDRAGCSGRAGSYPGSANFPCSMIAADEVHQVLTAAVPGQCLPPGHAAAQQLVALVDILTSPPR